MSPFAQVARFWGLLLVGYWRDGGLPKSASLAYQTVLAIVPMFTVAFSVLNAFTDLEGIESPVVGYLSRHLIPVSPEDIVGYIAEFSGRISVGVIGWIGIVVLILVSLILIDTVEASINSIWKVSGRRPLIFRFITYYAVLTLGPLLFVISFVQSARLQVLLPEGVDRDFLQYLIPIGINWVALVLSYRLFPNTAVRWSSVLLGALVGAILFEVAKVGFNVYVTEVLLRPYARIYGAIALFPVFLVWIFVAWNVVLIGVEVSYVHQNFWQILREKQSVERSGLSPREFLLLANERLALRLLGVVGKWFKEGRGPVFDVDLVNHTTVPKEVIQSVMNRLAHLGFVMIRDEGDGVSYLLARPMDHMPMAEVIKAYRGVQIELWPHEKVAGVETFLERLEEGISSVGQETHLANLVWEKGDVQGKQSDLEHKEGAELIGKET